MEMKKGRGRERGKGTGKRKREKGEKREHAQARERKQSRSTVGETGEVAQNVRPLSRRLADSRVAKRSAFLVSLPNFIFSRNSDFYKRAGFNGQ